MAELIEEDGRNSLSNGESSLNSSFTGDHEKGDEKTLISESMGSLTEPAQQLPSNNEIAEEQLADDPKPTEDEWTDILGTGNLMQKILRKSVSDIRPKTGELVKIVWKDLSSEGQEEHEVQFIFGYGSHLRALELPVSLMSIGEISQFKLNPQLVDDSNGKETYDYEIELLGIYAADDINLNSQINEARESGNVFFNDGKYEKAYNLYEYGIKSLSVLYPDESEDEFDMRKYTLISNSAACLLKMKEWSKVVEITKDLPLDQNIEKLILIKLTLRRSHALVQLKKYDQAMDSLKMCLTLDPSNTRAKALLDQTKSLSAKEEKRMDKIYKNMFKSMSAVSQPANDEGRLSKVRSFMMSRNALILLVLIVGLGAALFCLK